jgi:DNA-binding CsgD family transcriptional regulator
VNKEKRNRLAAYLRQLGSLELDSATTMPMAVSALRELVGADWGGFIWADEHNEPSALDCDNPAVYETWPRFDELRRNGEIGRVCGGDFRDWMRFKVPAPNSAKLDKRTWLSSAFCNDVVRASGTQQFCTTVVHDNGRGLGCMVLGRSAASRPFVSRDEELIASFNGHLSYALTRPPCTVEDYLDSGMSAALLVDTSARVLHRSPHGARLLRMVCDDHLLAQPEAASVPVVRELVDRLLATRQGASEQPPVRRITNRWGRFVWRGYSLGADNPTMLLHIQHELPRSTATARGAYALGLSPGQQAVALRLASGVAYRRIAQDLRVKESTVIDHARKLYAKIGVHDAPQLAERLLAAHGQ